jgi:hypothetical protein
MIKNTNEAGPQPNYAGRGINELLSSANTRVPVPAEQRGVYHEDHPENTKNGGKEVRNNKK